MLPTTHEAARPQQPVTASDLVRLRDFGDIGVDESEHAVAISPDGRDLVVQLRQGQPATNDYCTALVVLGVDGLSGARVISDTGDIVPSHDDLNGLTGIQLGTPVTAPAAWSTDGQWIAFVKTREDGAEIWRIRPDGQDAALIYRSPVPIDALAWTGDGSGLVFASRPALIAAAAAVAREGLLGYHYDRRFWPLADMVPHPLASTIATATQVVDLRSGTVRAAGADETLLVDPQGPPSRPKDATAFAISAGGRALAWAMSDHPGWIGARPRLHARIGAHEIPCDVVACQDVTGLWWLRDGGTLIFLRREGVARSRTGLYRWEVGHSEPRPLRVTDDALFGCHQDRDDLLCAHESALHPRSLVVIDGHSGTIRTLFDPNPEWAGMRLGTVERLTWRNSFGIETFGDLVLPVGYRPGRRVPLIVVQYESRGFLRGGTADDFPIQLYAAHGFAVMSVNRPPYPAVKDGPKPLVDYFRLNQKGWADRRSVQSSLETIVGQLAARGIIDPARVGVTGQSDGASAATFALIHSKLFAAAALSTCCEDSGMMATLGEAFADRYAATGYPRAGQDAPGFWANSSLDLHADRPPVPILIQASDQEARLALRTYTILNDAHWPIDMYIFPGESHVKLQSAHRLAMYERSLAWFEKWLGSVKAADALPQFDHAPQAAAHASISTH